MPQRAVEKQYYEMPELVGFQTMVILNPNGQKIQVKIHFSALKLYNFNFIAFHVSCDIQMHTSCHKRKQN